MRKTALLLVALLTAALVCGLAHANPKDVNGWRQAKWGMTEKEIMDAFKGEVKQLPGKKTYGRKGKIDYYSTLCIEDLSIGTEKYKAVFMMGNESNRLERILITPVVDKAKKNRLYYLAIKQLLIEKYGIPTTQEEKPESGRRPGLATYSSDWIFPSTMIKLSYFMMEKIDVFDMHLSYAMRSEKKTKNL